jgi:nicotinamide phosphoribosyltransferase
MFNENVILWADSYKYSQFNQYPEGTEYVYSYIESRGGIYDKVLYNGLQPFLHKIKNSVIKEDMIDEAEAIVLDHGEPFYREGWQHIVDNHYGRLPIVIKAIDEGTILPTKNILVSIMNTDPKCWWLPSFLETALLQAIWYPTTVASNSLHSKEIILDGLKKTGNPEDIDFRLHDFGMRGVSSMETAAIGATAHLINFKGTDTINSIQYIRRNYNEVAMPAFSVPAMEHSTVTSWMREGEVDSYRNMIKKNAKPGGIISVVSDSYDIFKACELWGTVLKQDVLDSGATLVVRPDSGDPAEVVTKCVKILDKYFGSVVNDKGFKVLNNVRVLQGDGINHSAIRGIIYSLFLAGYSTDNVLFGQGGALLQIVNRDDLKFAMKCSAACVNGEWRDVYKEPITDPGKHSKKGILALIINEQGQYETIRIENLNGREDLMKVRFFNGSMKNTTNFQEIRDRARIS